MPLSKDSEYGVKAMTEAINALPKPDTILGNLGLFEPKPITTTFAEIELLNGQLQLVPSAQRGTAGVTIPERQRASVKIDTIHLPETDIVLADDVQNVRQFGGTEAEAVADRVADKLQDGKNNLEWTCEHLRLGALKGKVLDKGGQELVDIYKTFGLTRKEQKLSKAANASMPKQFDSILTTLKKENKSGLVIPQWLVVATPELMQEIMYHESIIRIYERYQEASAYRNEPSDAYIMFKHKNIVFAEYSNDFGTGSANLEAGSGVILPYKAKGMCMEYFAPAPTNATVNTKGLPFYASRERLPHDQGWSLMMQSNPLPILTRPQLAMTLKIGN